MQIIKKYLRLIFFKIGGWEYIEKNLVLKGMILLRQNKNINKIKNLKDVEFSVFSQWGEDGIINWLTQKIPNLDKTFLEIGTQDYKESNTRFLLISQNWKGFILEGSSEHVRAVKKQNVYWKYDLSAFNFFINKENINRILKKIKIKNKIGLLSIDIDGNDYWILKEINNLEPDIIICEYNAVFGNKDEITVQYKNNFDRTKFHYSNLAFGASLPAFINLLKKKNYYFIGTNSNGVNAFFLKKNKFKYIKKYIKEIKSFNSKSKESKDKFGNKTFIKEKNRIKKISNVKVLNLKKNKVIKIKTLKSFKNNKWEN